jgi:hypothetical protein
MRDRSKIALGQDCSVTREWLMGVASASARSTDIIGLAANRGDNSRFRVAPAAGSGTAVAGAGAILGMLERWPNVAAAMGVCSDVDAVQSALWFYRRRRRVVDGADVPRITGAIAETVSSCLAVEQPLPRRADFHLQGSQG